MSLLAVGFWILQVVQHDKYDELAHNNHLRTIPLRAPRGVLFDRNGVCSSRTATRSRLRSSASAAADLKQTIQRLAAVTGVDEARDPRDASIAIDATRLPADPGHRARDVRAGRGGTRASARAARSASCSRCRRATIRRRMAAHLFGYVERDPGSAARPAGVRRPRSRRDRRPGRRREDLQRAAHGRGRRPARRRQQRRPRDRRAGRRAIPSTASGCSSRSTTTCSARSKTAFRAERLRRRRGVSRSEHRRNPGDDEPAGVRPERLRRRHRQARSGPSSTPIRSSR